MPQNPILFLIWLWLSRLIGRYLLFIGRYWTFIMFFCCTFLYFDLCIWHHGHDFSLFVFYFTFMFFVFVFPYLCQLLIPNWRCLCFSLFPSFPSPSAFYPFSPFFLLSSFIFPHFFVAAYSEYVGLWWLVSLCFYFYFLSHSPFFLVLVDGGLYHQGFGPGTSLYMRFCITSVLFLELVSIGIGWPRGLGFYSFPVIRELSLFLCHIFLCTGVFVVCL